ncbi:uncharacterized protein V6R79_023490 [Siganus canaliculatus]
MVLLLLTDFSGGQSLSSQSVVAMIGDDVTLPCQLDPVVDATGLIVEWARPDLQPTYVHLRREGVQLVLEENPSYKGRTSLNENKLKRGDLSLKLFKVKLSDAGKYKCFVPTLDMESVVELVVGSVSSPHIQVSKVNNGGELECKSSGWYPEPEVVWLDAEGKLLSEPKETTRGGDGLYTVSSRVTVEKKHSNGFTCRVQQQNISQTRETRIQVPADLFMLQFTSAVRFSIVVAVSFLFVVAVFFLVWKVAQDNKETTKVETELQLVKKDQRNTDLTTENIQIKQLEKTKAFLEHRSKRLETEIEEAEQVINGIKEQKTRLNVMKEQLVKLASKEQTRKKEYDSSTLSVFTDFWNLEYNRLLENIKEHEELSKNTQTQLESADEQFSKMTEMMTQLKMDKEQTTIDLQEVENEMKEIQSKIVLKQQQKDES